VQGWRVEFRDGTGDSGRHTGVLVAGDGQDALSGNAQSLFAALEAAQGCASDVPVRHRRSQVATRLCVPKGLLLFLAFRVLLSYLAHAVVVIPAHVRQTYSFLSMQ